jgi:hypothetical protein
MKKLKLILLNRINDIELNLINFAYSFKLVRMAIGGNWYLINDYRRNCQYWTPYFAEGYEILQREFWK